MVETHELLGSLTTGQFLRETLRALAPVVLNGIRLGGVAVSLIGGRRLLRRQHWRGRRAVTVDAVA